MKVKFLDGLELDAIQVNGSRRYFQGAQRDSLEFVFEKGLYSFDDLDEYFANKSKTSKITLIDDAQNQYAYDDYVLRASMVLTPIVVQPATSTTPEVTEERISVTMVQQTYLEKLVEQLLGEKFITHKDTYTPFD